MSRYPHKNLPIKKAELGKTAFKEKKQEKVGTKKSPAAVVVQTEERKLELVEIFREHDWAYVITVDPEQDEDIAQLEYLQNRKPTATTTKVQNRNDPCACGSGLKHKKCCLLKAG